MPTEPDVVKIQSEPGGGVIDVPDVVYNLIERFSTHMAEYHQSYSEAQVRQDFIDPLFEALDWDVKNIRGRAEAYREVVVEDALRIDGTVKAPDYAFRIGGQTKFYVEAKRPQVNIDHDKLPAYQLRRYGWNANLALSILTISRTLPSTNAPPSRS